MRNGKYMDDYNYHDWATFMVRNPAEKPKGPHFAAVLFGTRSEWVPAYDERDSPRSTSVPETTYFAFPDKETLYEWILRASKEKKQFFFFEVKKLGEAQLILNMDVEV